MQNVGECKAVSSLSDRLKELHEMSEELKGRSGAIGDLLFGERPEEPVKAANDKSRSVADTVNEISNNAEKTLACLRAIQEKL